MLANWLNCSACEVPDTRREVFVETTFGKIMNLCGDRMLQRVRPVWSSVPYWDKRNGTSLLKKLDNDMAQLEVVMRKPFPKTLSALKKMHKQLKHLNTMNHDGKDARNSLETIVLRSYDASVVELPRTLEAKLRRCGLVGEDLAGRVGIRQVDKLARYYGICKDLARLARQPVYRSLLSNVMVERLPFACGGPGIGRDLHVHAEVQLVMYYLALEISPAPRAIGCSKSACFLCHALISRLGDWSLSACHGRLYSKWTIPDGVRLERRRALDLASAIRQMRDELRNCAPVGGVNPPESRALSLLSGPSTTTLMPVASVSNSSSVDTIRPNIPTVDMGIGIFLGSPCGSSNPQKEQRGVGDAAPNDIVTFLTGNSSSPCPTPTGTNHLAAGSTTHVPCSQASVAKRSKPPSTTVRLTERDLPYEHVIRNNDMPPLEIRLGRLSLYLDFGDISAGQVKVTRDGRGDDGGSGDAGDSVASMEISELTTCLSGRTLSRKQGSNGIHFRLLYIGSVAAHVEVAWV